MSIFHCPFSHISLILDYNIYFPLTSILGFPSGSVVKICLQCKRCGFDSRVRKIPWSVSVDFPVLDNSYKRSHGIKCGLSWLASFTEYPDLRFIQLVGCVTVSLHCSWFSFRRTDGLRLVHPFTSRW